MSSNDLSHVAFPVIGKVVDLHSALLHTEGDVGANTKVVREEALVVLSAMKMESAVTAPKSGVIRRKGKSVEIGAIIPEGMLICVLDDKEPTIMSRL